MKILGWQFDKKDRRLEQQARSLVQVAKLHAVSSYIPTTERFDFIDNVDPKLWDIVVTIAGVFVAVHRLNHVQLGERRESRLSEVISKELVQWNPNGLIGFEDCKALFESEFDRLSAAGHEQAFAASDALGIWMVWNIFDRQPQTHDELLLVRALGASVTRAFFDWWD